MGPTLPVKISGGPYLLTPKTDMEPIEEQPFDFSRRYNEVLEEPERKGRTDCSVYQDDDMPRVYCTEGTPRLISRASSVGDITNGDKRRPETIHEQEEVQLASHTATANATPRMWSRGSSPNSLNSFCMTGTNNFDANSVVSEFSRQPSGLISPSDLPDSPGQTMPPSPKERRSNVYVPTPKHPFEYYQPNILPIVPTTTFTPITTAPVEKRDIKSQAMIQPNPEPRQMRTFRDKPFVTEQFIQEDSLRNYRTEDTPANLSAATSCSDLSSICPKSDYSRSDYSRPVPKPRKKLAMPPPQPLAAVETARNKSMPDLNRAESSSECNTEDDELLRETITQGRPSNRNRSAMVKTMPTKKPQTSVEKDSDSDSDQQEILDELIKLGRPMSRNQNRIKDKGEPSEESSKKSDRFKAARSMENLSPSKVVKKGATNFRIREQPLRGAEGAIPKAIVVRAQSLKGNKSLGYDPVHDRRQTKTPDLGEPRVEQFVQPSKPISKVSPMRSSQPSTSKKTAEEDEEACLKQVLLSPLRSSVRQSRQTSVKKTTELGVESDVEDEDSPPLPPKPAQFKTLPRSGDRPSPSVEAVLNSSMPDVVTHTVAETKPPVEENNNSELVYEFPPEPPEDCGDITVLRFKFADSNRSYTRRFLATNQFNVVISYLTCKGFPAEKYRVFVSSVLRMKREITENYFERTLAELKMVPKKTLTVKPR